MVDLSESGLGSGEWVSFVEMGCNRLMDCLYWIHEESREVGRKNIIWME